MKINFQMLFLSAAMSCGSMFCLPESHAAEAKAAPTKDAQGVITELRMKRWNKELEFTADQQARIKALLDEESKVVAKLDDDKSLAIQDRVTKVDEIHKATYAKIKPLLTEKQAPVFEKLTTKSTKTKKVAAPANP